MLCLSNYQKRKLSGRLEHIAERFSFRDFFRGAHDALAYALWIVRHLAELAAALSVNLVDAAIRTTIIVLFMPLLFDDSLDRLKKEASLCLSKGFAIPVPFKTDVFLFGPFHGVITVD